MIAAADLDAYGGDGIELPGEPQGDPSHLVTVLFPAVGLRPSNLGLSLPGPKLAEAYPPLAGFLSSEVDSAGAG